MQHAFAGGITHGIVSDVERRALALTGAGDMIWDWDVSADKVYTSPETEHAARPQARRARRPGRALARRAASARPRPLPRRARQRARAAARPADAGFPPAHRRRPLSLVRAQGAAGGRLRRRGGARWSARSPTSPSSRTPRSGCCTTRCTTTSPACPTASCSSTGSRRRFGFAKADPTIRPTVMVIDLDRFKQVNDSVGIAVGDSILLTLARRLGRLLKPQDTLARLVRRPVRADPAVGDASRRASSPSPRRMRRTLRAPITLQRPRDLPHRLDRPGARATASRTAPRRCSRTPSSRCITPSASAATASRCSSRRCARARPTG